MVILIKIISRVCHSVVNICLLGTLTAMSLDWKKCIICQESTKEALKCPLNSNGSPEANRQTYLAFLQNVNSFREANALPT